MTPSREIKPVTVVIPVYNRADTVRGTLRALEQQTCRDFEVMLVDNNSTDNTYEVLNQWCESHPDILSSLVLEMDPGAAAARNLGMSWTLSEWVMFFDSDDYMAPDHIERALKAVESHPDADIIGWDIMLTVDGKRMPKPFIADPYRCLFDGTMSTLRYMARRKIFQDAGEWNEGIRIWDDIELGLRMLNSSISPKVYKIEGEPTVEVRVQPDSITSTQCSIEKIEVALAAMSRTLGSRGRRWTDLKRAIFAANMPPEEGRAYMRRILSATDLSPARGAILRLAYTYTRLGGRGIARILRPLM